MTRVAGAHNLPRSPTPTYLHAAVCPHVVVAGIAAQVRVGEKYGFGHLLMLTRARPGLRHVYWDVACKARSWLSTTSALLSESHEAAALEIRALPGAPQLDSLQVILPLVHAYAHEFTCRVGRGAHTRVYMRVGALSCMLTWLTSSCWRLHAGGRRLGKTSPARRVRCYSLAAGHRARGRARARTRSTSLPRHPATAMWCTTCAWTTHKTSLRRLGWSATGCAATAMPQN